MLKENYAILKISSNVGKKEKIDNNNNKNNKLIFYEEASNHPEVVFRRVL